MAGFPSPPRKAFTLVELLVVIAIIGVLVALLLPAVQAAREAARRSSCANKLRQLAIGLHNHHDTNSKFPPGAQQQVFPQPNPPGNTTTFINGTTWIVFTLPYIEQKPLYDRYRFDLSYNDSAGINITNVGTVVVPTLYCPSGPDARRYLDPNSPNANTAVTTHYYGIMGPGPATGYISTETSIDNHIIAQGASNHSYRRGDAAVNAAWSGHGILSQYRETTGSISTNRIVRMADIIDGTSNTLLLGEISRFMPTNYCNPSSHSYRTWIRGNNGGSGTTKNISYPINFMFYNCSNNFNDMSMMSHHPGGAQFALGDASVRFIPQTIDFTVYRLAASMGSGELAPLQ